MNAQDFNDLLINTVKLLRSYPEVLSKLQKLWKYFMIDEYQDTNHAQYLIAKYLAKSSRNICVVGDDDQSIYSWRGADIRNILSFENDYNDARIITLEYNYRSTSPILEAASSIIKNNLRRKEKNLKAYKENGEPVICCQVNNEYGEAEFVINSMISLKNREGFKNKDFSIFYRTNAQSRIFEDLLRKENLNYRVIGGLKFYDRKEIKDILAYLKFISNTLDSVSLLRIINTPARGIGKATINRIKTTAREKNVSDWAVVKNENINGKIPKGLNKFKAIIENLLNISGTIPKITKLSGFILQMLDITGYRKILEDENTIENNSRIENIDEFINSVYDYEIINPDSDLDQFLQDISLFTSAENPENMDDNYVTLMTVHNSKGLEFPVVFLTGMEEDIFPHRFSIDTEEGIEEERRLCYVGITRAIEKIFITNADVRRTYGGINYREPSRFINEISGSNIEFQAYYSENPFSINRLENGSLSSNKYRAGPDSNNDSLTENPLNNSKFRVKENILHPKFGVGNILKIEGSGDNTKLTIKFNNGTKVFMEKYTPLEKIN